MGDFYFYDAPANNVLWAPSRLPAYGLQAGRIRNVTSAETLGGTVRSESRGSDRVTLTLEWKYLPLADVRTLESIHATYGANAAPFRIQVPSGVFPGVYGSAAVRVRWPESTFNVTAVAPALYAVRMSVVEDLATSLKLSGTITRDNAHLSMIAGTAFADLVGVDIGSYPTYYLVLTDSVGRRLAGWTKAAGGGETLGSELITASDDRTFASDTGWWTKGTNTTITAGVLRMTAAPGSAGITRASLLTVGRLYKFVSTVAVWTSGGYFCPYWGAQAYHNTAATFTDYGSATDTLAGFVTSGTVTADADNVSIKQVLTPSATGATIVSTRSGSTYNWTYEDTGFNRSDGAGYRYALYEY